MIKISAYEHKREAGAEAIPGRIPNEKQGEDGNAGQDDDLARIDTGNGTAMNEAARDDRVGDVPMFADEKCVGFEWCCAFVAQVVASGDGADDD